MALTMISVRAKREATLHIPLGITGIGVVMTHTVVVKSWIDWHHNDIAHWGIGMDYGGPLEVEAIGWTFPQTDVYNTAVNYDIRCRYKMESNHPYPISTRSESSGSARTAGCIYPENPWKPPIRNFFANPFIEVRSKLMFQ